MTYTTLAKIQANYYVGHKKNLDTEKLKEWNKVYRHWYNKLRKLDFEDAEEIVLMDIEKELA